MKYLITSESQWLELKKTLPKSFNMSDDAKIKAAPPEYPVIGNFSPLIDANGYAVACIYFTKEDASLINNEDGDRI